jgi:hypothetical protein
MFESRTTVFVTFEFMTTDVVNVDPVKLLLGVGGSSVESVHAKLLPKYPLMKHRTTLPLLKIESSIRESVALMLVKYVFVTFVLIRLTFVNAMSTLNVAGVTPEMFDWLMIDAALMLLQIVFVPT